MGARQYLVDVVTQDRWRVSVSERWASKHDREDLARLIVASEQVQSTCQEAERSVVVRLRGQRSLDE